MIGGIPEAIWRQILDILKKHANITEVILYGSRAKGNFHNGSDIDLALKGKILNGSRRLKRAIGSV